MRTALLFTAAAICIPGPGILSHLLVAQGPAASVQILAPSLRVIAGERLQLSAVVRDASGTVRPNDVLSWAVDNQILATISPSNPVLITKSIGIVRVIAAAGPVSSSLYIQILPKSIVITPAAITLTVGDTTQFQAAALDINDQPISNLTFTWSTTSTAGGTTNTSTVRNGLLTTLATGDIMVRAAIGFGTSVPGFDRYVSAIASVSIRPPKNYTLKKLVSSGPLIAGPFELRGRIVQLLGNDQGQMVFNSELSGLVNGPLMLDSGTMRLLAYGGMPGLYPQSMIAEFNYLAINNPGDVLAHTTVLGSNNTIYKLTNGGKVPVFIDGSPLPGTETLSGSYFNRNCLNDAGDFTFRVSYRVQNVGPTITAVLLVPDRGFPTEIVSTATGLPDFPPTYTVDTDFGLDGHGTVYFTATSGTRRALFVNTYGDVTKVLEIGTPLGGSTVSRFLSNGFFMNNEGDMGVVVGLANGQLQVLKYTGGNWDAPASILPLRSFGYLYGMNRKAGALFLGDAGKGYGIHLWDGNTDPKVVFLQSNNGYLLRGKNVPVIDWATVNGQGDVTFFVRSQDSIMELLNIKAGDTAPTVMMSAGDMVPVYAARISVNNILNGDRMGPVHLLTGGRGSSVFEVSPYGDLKPVLLHGERYSTTALFTGSGTADTRKSSTGALYVTPTNGAGLLRIINGTSEFIVKPGMALDDGSTINSPNTIASNVRGDLLFQASTNRGDTRLILVSGGNTLQLLSNSLVAQYATSIDGQEVIAWSDQIVDEGGRVMATLRFRDNSTAIYLWDGSAWKKTAAALESRVNGSVVNSISQIRTAGDGFYAIFNLAGLGNTLFRYRTAWELVFDVNELLVTGQRMNSIGNYDVNRNGDILAQCNTNTQVLVVKRANGKTYYIHMLNELTPDGDLLVRTSDFDLRDDGTVYFLGMNILDEYALYMAKPLN